MELLNLCFVFFRIGIISFGGGWTIVGIIKDEVLRAGWLTDAQFANVVSIAQVTPGPVALNAATLVGYQRFGVMGAILSTLSVVAFPMISIGVATFIASRIKADKERVSAALRVGTLAMVAMTFVNLSASSAVKPLTIGIAVASFLAAALTKVNPLILILGAGTVGALMEIFL
jgi:chromate transporter